MIKKYVVFTALFLLITIVLHAEVITLFGKTENAGSYTIKLKIYQDYLSMFEENLDESVVHPDGTFRLSATLNENCLAILSIGFQEALIYLEPGKSYELLVNYDKTREQITFVNKPHLQLQFRNLPSDDLNIQMAEFNSRADQFLIANFNRIFKSKNRTVINEFRKELEVAFQNPSPYLKASINYRLASIEYSAGLIEKAALYESYIKNRKILYHHIHPKLMYQCKISCVKGNKKNQIIVDFFVLPHPPERNGQKFR